MIILSNVLVLGAVGWTTKAGGVAEYFCVSHCLCSVKIAARGHAVHGCKTPAIEDDQADGLFLRGCVAERRQIRVSRNRRRISILLLVAR